MKYNVLFYVVKDACPDGRLRMRVRCAPGEFSFNVGYRVTLARWNAEAQRCTRGSFHGKNKTSGSIINGEIQRFEDAVRSVLSGYSDGDSVSVADLRSGVQALLKPEAAPRARTLLNDYDDFVIEQGAARSWSDATYKKMATVRQHLVNYAGVRVSYEDLNERGMRGFVDYLLSDGKRNRTTEKYIKTLRWFLRWADRKCLSGGLADTEYKPHLKSVDKRVIFLTWSELMQVWEHEFGPGEAHLSRVRDRFCFSCFTGLRFSDVASLLKTQVQEDAIVVVTKKTDDTLRIELNKYSREIIRRSHAHNTNCNTLFPRISAQRFNDYIKEVGRLCGLDSEITEVYYQGGTRLVETHKKYELLSSHCGRRTFICNALTLGIPPDVVMKWTGHSDYKAMRPYIDIADEAKKTAMALFDKKEP